MANAPKFQELTRLWNDEDAAREWLEARRWPEGPVCAHCGSVNESYRLTPKATSSRPVRKGVWKCRKCRKQYTVTIGTVFAESHIALNKWLYAIHLMCSAKKGVSANQLARTLGVQYKTAWFMAHRIRKVHGEGPGAAEDAGRGRSGRNLRRGLPEGIGKSGPTARGTKAIVFTLIDRDGDARSQVVPNVQAKTLKPIIRKNVEGTAHIMTDQHQAYFGLGKDSPATTRWTTRRASTSGGSSTSTSRSPSSRS